MDGVCRLCCSTKFVNNHIYNEENALYLKMSLYLPVKVARGDGLPQRVCDRCSCRVNDMYQFCNEAIEVQSRLRSIFLSSGLTTDLNDVQQIKDDVHSPPAVTQHERGTQTDTFDEIGKPEVEVKEESKPLVQVKTEDTSDYTMFDHMGGDIPSDNSEDMSLINLKKKKKKSDKKEMNGTTESKHGKKRKKDLKEWDILLNALPPGTMVRPVRLRKRDAVKEEELPALSAGDLLIKQEPTEDKYDCCICFAQCYSRGEMLQHYRQHGAEAEAPRPPPAAPPPPDARPLRCPRCSKVLEAGAWASHWLRHWERDRRPYRCARCEKTFRDHHQILKHGLTHKAEEAGAGAEGAPGKRFVCDLCPEGFVYMRYLLAHRTRAHPEAAARALALRCAECAREFAHLNSLRRHLRAHSGERNFLCSVCGKALSSREHLKFHLRIHAGYKPNICKTCGKGFVKKCNLTLHERVHSGEKPHVCAACGKAFSQRSTLVIHERYHSGARPYACALCGRGFVAKGLLSMHLKTTCI